MKLRIFFKAFEKQPLECCFEQYRQLLLSKFHSKCQLLAAVSLPIRLKKFCVLRSPHVDKDSREQYEFRLYKKFFDIQLGQDYTVLDDLLNIEIPSGVAISLVKLKSYQ